MIYPHVWPQGSLRRPPPVCLSVRPSAPTSAAPSPFESSSHLILKTPRWCPREACPSFPTCPARRVSFSKRSVPWPGPGNSRGGGAFEGSTHVGVPGVVEGDSWHGDDVGEGQPCGARCPAEEFVALDIEVCGPLAVLSRWGGSGRPRRVFRGGV
jgi:hypothetical protein